MNDIDNLLLEAMNAETKAEEFYTHASSKAQSQAGREFFKELADFEHHHYEKVKEIIDSRKKGSRIEPLKPRPELRKIKSEVEGEFEPNKNEIVEILTLGIKAEKEAQERYTKIAKNLSDSEGKEIFKELAEDERRHHDLLEAQYYQMSNKGVIIWE
jgi:rubrerythrin